MLLNCGAGENSWESLGLPGLKKKNQPYTNKPWIFIERKVAEAETPILQPPHVKSQLNGKDSAVGKDWRQEENGTDEDEMVQQHKEKYFAFY